jgi:hypothetical protein
VSRRIRPATRGYPALGSSEPFPHVVGPADHAFSRKRRRKRPDVGRTPTPGLWQHPDVEARASIRPAKGDDASDLAELWIEFGRYYANLNPEQYQEPKQEGLVEWFRRQLHEQQGEDQTWLVAEGSSRLLGSIHGEIWRPREGAEWGLIRDDGETSLKIDHLIVTERSGERESVAGSWRRRRLGVVPVELREPS